MSITLLVFRHILFDRNSELLYNTGMNPKRKIIKLRNYDYLKTGILR